jgi:hypothetical protein
MTTTTSVSRFFRGTACAVSVCLSLTAFMQPAHATLISTEQVAQEAALQARTAEGQAQRDRLAGELDRPELLARLQQFGVTADQARDCVAALTDEEASRMVAQIEQAPAGGDVIGTVVFIFVLLLVTDILGLTKIFPFTRSVR